MSKFFNQRQKSSRSGFTTVSAVMPEPVVTYVLNQMAYNIKNEQLVQYGTPTQNSVDVRDTQLTQIGVLTQVTAGV